MSPSSLLFSLIRRADFLVFGELPANTLHGEYNLPLLAFGGVTGAAMVYMAIQLICRIPEAPPEKIRILKLSAAGLLSACFWCGHVLAMTAYHINVHIDFDPALLFASLAGTFMVCLAVVEMATPPLRLWTFITAGVASGLLLPALHFGTATSMTMDGKLVYHAHEFLLAWKDSLAGNIAGFTLLYSALRQKGWSSRVFMLLGWLTISATVALVYYDGLEALAVLPDRYLGIETDQSFNAMRLCAAVVVFASAASGGYTLFNTGRLEERKTNQRLRWLREYGGVVVTALAGVSISVFACVFVIGLERQQELNDFAGASREMTREINSRLNMLEVRGISDTAISHAIVKEIVAEAYTRRLMVDAQPTEKIISPVEVSTQQGFDYVEFISHKLGSWRIHIQPWKNQFSSEPWSAIASLLGGLVMTLMAVVYLASLVQRRHQDLIVQADLRRAKEGAEQASRAKSDFLATMSHEIRTPMNGVFGMLDLLLRTRLNPTQEDLAQTARRSADTLQGILNDILDFSKIEQGALQLETTVFNLHGLIDDVIDTIAPIAEKKGISLMSHYMSGAPEYFSGDMGRIRQILINLVGNALKFTTQGHVLVRVKALDAGEGRSALRLEVEDTGIGIAPEKHGAIFERFSQADSSTTRLFGGTGLGLTICKNLVEIMGGRIGLESSEGRGSTFWLELQLPRASAPPARGDRRNALADLTGQTVLLVEDNGVNAHIFKEVIEHLGARCDVVETYAEAVAKLEAAPRGQYNLSLIDHGLPDGTGLELGRWIRRQEKLGEMRLLGCTSLGSSADNKDFAEAGFDGFLAKPIRSSLLENMLLAVSLRQERTEMLTRFTLRHGEDAQAGEEKLASGYKILIVEDDATNQKVASRFVNLLGSEATIAENGQEALTMLEGQTFDLVFMDMRMPVMDGPEATRKIRERETAMGLKRMPIIAFTANATREDVDTCLGSGMDDFIRKPIKIEVFNACLRKWLGKESEEKMIMDTVVEKNRKVVFNQAHFDEVTGGDIEFQKELVTTFKEGTTDALKKLMAHVPGEEEWSKAAHRIKGASVNLGLEELGSHCFAAEKATDATGKAGYISAIVNALEAAMRALPKF